MEVPLQTLLEEMLAKTDALSKMRTGLESRIEELSRANEALELELQRSRQEANRLRRERDFLTVSRRLADNPDALIAARRHISRLIRRLDASITRLEEDPAL